MPFCVLVLCIPKFNNLSNEWGFRTNVENEWGMGVGSDEVETRVLQQTYAADGGDGCSGGGSENRNIVRAPMAGSVSTAGVLHCDPPSLQQTLSEKHKSSLGHMTSQQTKKPEHDAESISTSNVCDDSSIYSSFYSFLKTDKSDESMKSSPNNENEVEDMVWEKSERRNIGPIKKVAPWLEDVALNSELSHRYQLQDRELATLLAGDSAALLNTTQPSLVNEQLSQLYLELELAGLSRQLSLEEAITSSSDSSGEDAESPPPAASHLSKKKRYMEYDKMVIMFEENAPLPPPAVTMPCNE